MLTTTELNAIGRQLRAENDARPKGAIPHRLWRLLLAIERWELAGR